MADRKISDLTALTAPAAGDYLPIVDISEAAAANKNKRITIEELFRGIPLGTAAAPSIAIEGDENTGIYSPGADQVAISTNGTGRLFVDSTGRVGVNTSSPAAGLDVNNTVFTRGGHKIQGYFATSAEDGNVINIGTSGGVNYIQSLNGATQSQLSIDGNPIVFRGASFSEIARFDTSGRLGLGTSSPSARLHVSGGDSVVGSTNLCRILSNGQVVDFTNAAQDTYVAGRINGLSLKFYTNTGNGIDIDSSGRVGIGTTSPAQILHLSNTTAVDTYLQSTNSLTSSYYGTAGDGRILYWTTGAYPLVMGTSNLERVRIDSSGRLLVGTSTARANLFNSTASPQLQVESTTYTGAGLSLIGVGNTTYDSGTLVLAHGRGGAVGSNTIVQNGATPDILGYISFQGNDGSEFVEGASIKAETDATPGANDMPSKLVFSTTADGASSPTERMRITNSGNINIGSTNTNIIWNQTSVAGVNLEVGGAIQIARSNDIPLLLNRIGNDGVLVTLAQDGVSEGNISVSGTTVSYNGAHLSRWSQLPGGAVREEILRGTVLSNIDEMCAWGEEDNEQLNRMKVSDIEGDPNVAGVFQAWDDDDDTYTDDFYCAMTGDFIIRIAEGVTVQRGDLLMSAGDGTAKPQDDDIIRSKTIAKVTSIHVTCTYDDGSYCVPCVLMAC